MNSGSNAPSSVLFRINPDELDSNEVWEYGEANKRAVSDVAAQTVATLAAPDDFPPIEAAIVPGDKVVVAVDPNVPQIDEVIQGALQSLKTTPAGPIEVVLWDEATVQTIDESEKAAGDHLVLKHQCDSRESVCYLAADVEAEPIYLNRAMVEADFVLPIVAVRPSDVDRRRDITGIFPALADSATRQRFASRIADGTASKAAMKSGNTIAEEVPWLLGVQLVLTVTANADGRVGEVLAGTPEAISKRVTPTLRRPDPVPPPADLVVASLDGGQQQQTWENVVRAAEAATLYSQPNATIVIWSALRQEPTGALRLIDRDDHDDETSIDRQAIESMQATGEDEPLPTWDASQSLATRLSNVTKDHRVLLHSELGSEVIEPMGLGVVESTKQLAKLSTGFASCGILRAAQFAGGNCG